MLNKTFVTFEKKSYSASIYIDYNIHLHLLCSYSEANLYTKGFYSSDNSMQFRLPSFTFVLTMLSSYSVFLTFPFQCGHMPKERFESVVFFFDSGTNLQSWFL